MQILVSYSRVMAAYVVKTAKLEHNHAVGADQFRLYATERRPRGETRWTAEVLLGTGANPRLVTKYLHERNVPVKPSDVYNIRRKLAFRGMSVHPTIKQFHY